MFQRFCIGASIYLIIFTIGIALIAYSSKELPIVQQCKYKKGQIVELISGKVLVISDAFPSREEGVPPTYNFTVLAGEDIIWYKMYQNNGVFENQIKRAID